LKDTLFSAGREDKHFSDLRQKAEKMLNELGQKAGSFEHKDVQLLLQELQIHQIELEMQNDELRLANEQLEFQQIKLSGIYDLAPVGYFILDSAGLIQEINRTGRNLLEIEKTSVGYKRLQEYIKPDDRESFYRFYRQLLLSGERLSLGLKMISKRGREFHAHIAGIIIQSNVTTPLECYMAIIDVTERIQAEQNQLETNERLGLALEASSSGIWELDPETMTFYLDDFSSKLCGIDKHHFGGSYKDFCRQVHSDDRNEVDQHFRTSLNNDKEIDITCRLINTEKKLCYVSIRGHITGSGAERRFVGIMMDITEKRRIEEETARLKQDQQKNITRAILNAQESEQRRISDSLHDGVSQLLYGIKMKLTPHTSKSGTEKCEVRELLDMAINEVRNISFELAPSLLKDFGLPTTIDEMAKRLSTPTMAISSRFVGLKDRLDLTVETSVFRIIQELINNCMKHAEADLIHVEIRKEEGIAIKVKDNGKGFNTKLQESKPSGTGLSSIRNRVNLYNGTMSITSSSGNGTTVKITLNP
jgi:PAS domain S-box-containing protein